MLIDDFETGFDIDESSEATLNIQHDGAANRTKLTAQAISSTAFAARLRHVQYGTWHGEDAVLLGFSFEFRFPNDSMKRITAAVIRLTLEATPDATFSEPSTHDPKNDPHVVLLAPGQVRGSVTKQSDSSYWQLRVPVRYNCFGLEAGVEGGLGQETRTEAERSMWISGFSDSDDAHHDDNAVVWATQENRAQRSGILHRFPAALVAKLPRRPRHPVKLTSRVTPTVAFSLNPLRLRQKRDDPVFLDRVSVKGPPVAPELDFSSADFPWDQIVDIPDEYSDLLTV